jgi:chorismate mutase
MGDHDEVLDEYRSSIDNIDAALVHLLAERFKITRQVGDYKAEGGLPVADPEREALQVARMRALAEEAGVDPVFSEKFLRFVIDEVIRHHERAGNGD